ncbi:MAG: hypothetical protein NTW25_03150, partial [Candidatus Kapabacteria bacterium]|nr:hypothetical protein [Candidatus Kapabacteria bacterium]
SGVLRYLRVEFGGIAESPDNELNGVTFGAVGNRTIVDYVQASYSGDDSFEWFGGTVNCKHIIAYNGIDDDFDTDNGYRGKLQFGIGRRFNDIADISNSESFESDNDASASENQPFTNPIFSNFTCIGGVMDTSYTAWSAGADYLTRYHPKFLTSAQIRRNSRMALYNSVLVGWPAGVELTNNNTVRAANADSVKVKYNDFYGIRGNKYFYAGGSTTFSGTVSTNWLATTGFGNNMTNGIGNVGTLAGLNDAFAKGATFNPSPILGANYLNSATYTDNDLSDSFFEKVSFRGAMDANKRWDIGWTEYDPINNDYKPLVTSTSFIKPAVNDSYRVGRSTILQWDTTSHLTNGKTLKFSWSLSANSTSWSVLPMPKGKLEFVDGTALKATGTVNTTMPNIATATLYIKLEDKNDPTFNAIVGPITVTIPAPGVVDSTLKGDITGIITLSSKKIYGLDGVVYVQSGGVLRIEPGTILKGDNTKTSAICVNRGGIIYANGTAQKPIVMTSGQPVGQRERGDWGGLLIMGKAKSNLIESPIEGGIADDATIKKNAWFGGTDDA